MIMGNGEYVTNFWNCKKCPLLIKQISKIIIIACVPVKFTTVLLRFPKAGVSLFGHMTVCTMKLHRVMESDDNVGCLEQATVVLLVVSGQSPQFVCNML